MKKVILLIFILSFYLQAQNVNVVEVRKITTINQGQYYYPQYSPNQGSMLFTSGNYVGLWSYNLSTQKITQLNNHRGAGYEPVFSDNGSRLVFRVDEYRNGKKYTSIVARDLLTENEVTIQPAARSISTPRFLSSGNIAFVNNSNLEQVSKTSLSKVSAVTAIEPVTYIEYTKIVLFHNGNKQILDPNGGGHYIWPSVSPDKKKLLFTEVSKGTFISDLQGNILVELGYANAPVWSPDGEWIAYMVDHDDGYIYTSADLYIVKSDGSVKFQLTDTELIEMYPRWSPDSKNLVFNSSEGEIYIISLSIE